MARIEKIRLRNFKSFKSVEIPLTEGCTVVVGPNGSGKSNIFDALLFVLGTRSAKAIRAERLHDLVSHASRDGTAEVALDVSNGPEAYSISRAIDRAGGSVYRLNGKRVAKNQVEDLLLSMNIRPDGHNIIKQGEITEILEKTPKQRREIIDEISGIMEFEEKKQDALRELEKVNEKLKEASIVITERKAHLKELEAEKEQAAKYNDLRTKLHVLKASLLKKELAEAEARFDETVRLLAQKESELAGLEQKKSGIQAGMADIDRQLMEIAGRLYGEWQKKVLDARSDIEGIKGSIRLAEGRESSLGTELERSLAREGELRSRKEELLASVEAAGNEIASLDREMASVEGLLAEERQKMDALEDRSGAGALSIAKKLEEMTACIDREKLKLHGMQSETAAMREKSNLKKSLVVDKNRELVELREKESRLQSAIAGISAKAGLLREALGKKQRELMSLESKEMELTGVLRRAESETMRAREERAEVASKVRMPGVEAVKGAKELRGILGTVADLCSYDDRNSLAIEAAAGARLTHVITETADDAISAIKFLKASKAGRATFIPLDRIRAPAPEEKDKRAAELVINLLRYDKKIEPAMRWAFGNTQLVADLDVARAIGINRARMVTPQGDLCDVSGAITGGHAKRGPTILELKRLDARIGGLEAEAEGLRSEISGMRERISKLREEKTSAELEFRELAVREQEFRRNLNEHAEATKAAASSMGRASAEQESLEKSLAERAGGLQAFEETVSRLIGERSKLSAILESPGAREAGELQARVRELRDRKEQCAVRIGTLHSQVENVLKKGAADADSELQSLLEFLGSLREDMEKARREKSSLGKALAEKESREKELSGQMSSQFAEHAALNEKKSKEAEALGELNFAVNRLREGMTGAMIEKGRLETHIADRSAALAPLGGLAAYAGVEFVDDGAESLKTEMTKTEALLNAFGNVNLRALDMFAAHVRELEDMGEKKNLLEGERDTIMNAIAEIEKKKIDAFMQTFTALNANFDRYFQEFYPEGGARACLKLENAENPLESGLLFEAQPPNSKPRYIGSLSGGEKTLVVLSFLFAIQAYNPSPFYALDESDAALDKENSQRAARMFKNFSRLVQLFVVTHNAGVVQSADRVIGVHKAKDGSSVVQLDLQQYAREKAAA